MRHGGQSIDLLAREGDTDEPGTRWGRALSPEREGAVVEAATHSEAHPARIEADEWHQYDVETVGAHFPRTRQGFGNAIAVGAQFAGIARKRGAHESELPAPIACDARQVEQGAAAGEGREGGENIDLFVEGRIGGDASTAGCGSDGLQHFTADPA